MRAEDKQKIIDAIKSVGYNFEVRDESTGQAMMQADGTATITERVVFTATTQITLAAK